MFTFYVIFCLIKFSDFTLTLLKVVHFDQLLGAVLCRVLYIPISSMVLLVLCLISYHDTHISLNENVHTKHLLNKGVCIEQN